MNITSAKFVKGVVEDDEILEDGKPQIVFIGRSNVGKSSIINALCGQKGLAKTSSFPGHTQEINIFLINKDYYFVDLPGYGFAKASKATQEKLQQLIYWYLLGSNYEQKIIVLIIDAVVGPTQNDMQMLYSLKQAKKNILVVVNKVDKIKPSQYGNRLKELQKLLGDYKIIPCAGEKKIGIQELNNLIFK
jgi:GTP-binding protein